MTEEQLIQEIKKNPGLFGQVYDEHYGTIFNYCYRRTNDFNSSKDITSETFLKAFINIKKFKWRGVSLIHWLYRIAINEINLHYRSKKYRPSYLSQIDSSTPSVSIEKALLNEQKVAEWEFNKHEQFMVIQRLLKTLPLKYQEVISLKYFEKMKISEISSLLNKPEGTIKSLLSRGIALMKDRV